MPDAGLPNADRTCVQRQGIGGADREQQMFLRLRRETSTVEAGATRRLFAITVPAAVIRSSSTAIHPAQADCYLLENSI